MGSTVQNRCALPYASILHLRVWSLSSLSRSPSPAQIFQASFAQLELGFPKVVLDFNLTTEQEMSVCDMSSELARLRLTPSHLEGLIDADMKEVQSETKTCKRCKRSFATESNSNSACRFHPTYFVSRRHDDQKRYYELGPDDPPYAAKFWDCCGSEDPDAEGCKTSFHVSYDEG